MGTAIEHWNWLKQNCCNDNIKKILFEGATIFDMGPQNLYANSDRDSLKKEILEFILHYNPELVKDENDLELFAEKMANNSVRIAPAENRPTYIGEILVKAGFNYTSFDIYNPGVEELNNQILDLNKAKTPSRYKEKGDLVLNFGTSEHIFNQRNVFEIIHELTKENGFMWHQIPFCGYLDHGYFNYNPKIFEILAQSNGYDVVHFEVFFQGDSKFLSFLESYEFLNPIYAFTNLKQCWHTFKVPNGCLSIIFKKTKNCPFQIGLDVSTTAGSIDSTITQQYIPQLSDFTEKESKLSYVNNFTSTERCTYRSQDKYLEFSSFVKNITKWLPKLQEIRQFINRHFRSAHFTSQAYANTGKFFSEKGNLEEAIINYQLAIALRKNFIEAYLELGNLLSQQRKWDDAIENYNKAIALKPTWAEAYFYRGNALQVKARYNEAIQDYQKAVSLGLNWPELRTNFDRARALKIVKFESRLKRRVN